MSVDSSGNYLGFSYPENQLIDVESGTNVIDSDGNKYYSNAGTNWKYADLPSQYAGLEANFTGANPAPITCNKVSGCPGIFNINNIKADPSTNSTNDRVNYLAADGSTTGTVSRASTSENFNNFNNVYRFPYVEIEGSTENMYCFEPKGPQGAGCEDGFICAQMDGIVPLQYQTKYFSNNQTSGGNFQGPATNICYGGNFNLVNTNYQSNKKDPIQPSSSSYNPLYPERGVTLYQNPGCNREYNPDNKNNKYIGGTIKYEGKGVEIFGNCDVCFYQNPFWFYGIDKDGNYADGPYVSLELMNQDPSNSNYNFYTYTFNDSKGFTGYIESSGSTNISQNTFNKYNGGNFGQHPADAQNVAGIMNPTPNIFECISIIRNDGLYSAIDYIDPDLKSVMEGYKNFSFDYTFNLSAKPVPTYNINGSLVVENVNLDKTYNYAKYCGDYGLRFLPNQVHDASKDLLGENNIVTNKLIKGIFRDPTLTLSTALDLSNPSINAYYSEICPIPCAPNIDTSRTLFDHDTISSKNYAFNGTVSSIFDGFSSIYIPPHMEVISVCSYDSSGVIERHVYPTPIRYEDSPIGDGCFPSFHPSDKFGIYGNSLVAISVRVRKDSAFTTKYVNNPMYNASAKSLEPVAPSNFGTVSTFRPEVLLLDPRPSAKTGTIPNITKGEFYQYESDFPIEDAFGGYLVLREPYKQLLAGTGKKQGWFGKLKDKLKGNTPELEMLYKSVFRINMNPNINVFSLEWLYVLYYCAMTNIVNGSGGCQATYVNEANGQTTGLLANGYENRCNINNMSCLLFNKPLGCDSCNLTGNNMVLASGTTNTCANSTFGTGTMGPSSADLFMSTYAANMSNKIFPFYFSLYQAGNIDCACIANIGQCPWNNWLPCSQNSDQYKLNGKAGAYLLCAQKNATSTRDCSESLIDCNNYIYQYGEGAYNSTQNANLTGSCITYSGTGDDDGPPSPDKTTTTSSSYLWIGILVILLIIIVIVIAAGGIFAYKKGYIRHK